MAAPISINVYRSAFRDSSDRACSSASTAGNANVSIDYILSITLGNSTNRAAVSTRTARSACIRNLVSHCKILLLG